MIDIVERHLVHLRKQTDTTAGPLFRTYAVPAAKRVSTDLLQIAAHKDSEGVSSSENFKACRNPSEMNWVVEVRRG